MTLEEGKTQLREHLDPMWTAYNGWCLHRSFESGGQWLWLEPDDPTVIWMHTEHNGTEDTSMYLSDAPFIKRDGWELVQNHKIQEWVDEAFRRANADTVDPEWQYVLYARMQIHSQPMDVLLIPFDEDYIEFNFSPAGAYSSHTNKQLVELSSIASSTLLNSHDEWKIYKWRPNDERRIFTPAMEAMITT